MKILVTGGAGFIGSNFITYLFDQDTDVEIVNIDKLTYAGNPDNLKDIEDNGNYTFIKGDITDRQLVNDIFEKFVFDYILNFAAETHVDRSFTDVSPFIDTNIRGTHILLEAARKNWETEVKNVEVEKKFIQISTDEVYGSIEDEGSFTEASPLQPNNPYAASKAAADMICRSYYKAFGLPVIITRSSNNYGPRQFPEKLIPVVIKNVLAGMPVPIYGDGINIRDWLYVEDNCRAINLVMRKGKKGDIYNIGGGNQITNIDLAKSICNFLENNPGIEVLKPHIEFVEDPRGNAHDKCYSLDCSKINQETGWRPFYELDKGIEQTIQWYLNNWLHLNVK